MPKRKGHILEQIADIDNLRYADALAQEYKNNRAIRRHNKNQEKNLAALRTMILTLDFPKDPYNKFELDKSGDKRRDIHFKPYYPWSILYYAILHVIGEDIVKSLIYDSSACIKGRGTLYGAKRVKMFVRRYPEYKWFVKTDCKKFYQSIPHELILSAFRRKFKDEKFIKLIEIAVLDYDAGADIEKTLEDEINRKRHCHWSLYQSDRSQFCSQLNRSSNEGKVSGEVHAQILRRQFDAGKDKGGSHVLIENLREGDGLYRPNSKGKRFYFSNRKGGEA